ncbi:MAG: MotA/TolQ/ExbB proton channel family protein [Bdellovibrionia bacterium]
MLNKIFLGMSLLGAEWVLYFLLLLSVLSVALIFERFSFYRKSSRGLKEFRGQIRAAISSGRLKDATLIAQNRNQKQTPFAPDLETEMTLALISLPHSSTEILGEVAKDSVIRARMSWDKNLSILATIGSNAPFIGLFGTVLGIIKAFHDLSQQNVAGSQVVTSGIAEALVATAVGLLVAIPAVVAFNLFQRRVKSATAEAEALKSFLVGNLVNQTAPKVGK